MEPRHGQTHRLTLTGHTNSVYSVTTAQLDGQTVIISASNDKTIRTWDLQARVGM